MCGGQGQLCGVGSLLHLDMNFRDGVGHRGLHTNPQPPHCPSIAFDVHQTSQEGVESSWQKGLLPCFPQHLINAKASLLPRLWSLSPPRHNCPLRLRLPLALGCVGSHWPVFLPTQSPSVFHPVAARGRFPEWNHITFKTLMSSET